MHMFSSARRLVALSLAVVLIALAGPTGLAQARVVGSGEALTAHAGASVADQRAEVIRLLSRADVQSQMRGWGVDPAEAKARVNAMSEAEVAELSARLDAVKPGQSAVGAVVGAAVLVFVILVITDILGFTDVFPFTNKAN